MTADVSKLIEGLKVAVKVGPATIALGSGFLLLGPHSIVGRLGVDELLGPHRGWLGLTFAGSAAGVLVNTAAWIVKIARPRWRGHVARQEGIKHLNDLTPAEKSILRGYVDRDTRSLLLDIRSGVVSGLESSKIIYRAATVGDMLDGFAYNIQPWAWDYLRGHKSLLDGAETAPDTPDPRRRRPRRP